MRLAFFLLGSGIGAVTRYLIDDFFRSRYIFPWGILFVNVFGSFLLGFFIESDQSSAFLGLGFCGALTTWSALALDFHRSIQKKKVFELFLNLTLNFLLGVGALLLAMNLAG